MLRAVAVLAVVLVTVSAGPVRVSEGEGAPREKRFAQGQASQFSPANLQRLRSMTNGRQNIGDMVRQMTGQSLDQLLTSVTGRKVNVQELLAQAGNDTSSGDPWTKVAEQLFGKQAVSNAMAQVERFKAMMNSTSGQADMMNRMRQMMSRSGFTPSGRLQGLFNQRGASVQNLFNPPGNGGVRMPADPSSTGNANNFQNHFGSSQGRNPKAA